MKKTEESLRRLKKGQTATFSLFKSANNGKDEEMRDQERIRTQLIVDVNAFGKDAESIGVDVLGSQVFASLNVMVHASGVEGVFLYSRVVYDTLYDFDSQMQGRRRTKGVLRML
jgi:hypothetical protein